MTPDHFENFKSVIRRGRVMQERLARITDTLLGQQPMNASSDAVSIDPLEGTYYSVEEMSHALGQEPSNVLFNISDSIDRLDNGLHIDDLRSMMQNEKNIIPSALCGTMVAGKGKTRGNT